MHRNPYVNHLNAEFAEALSHVLNRVASSSAAGRELLEPLEDKSIRIQLTDYNDQFILSVTDQTVHIDREADGAEDVVVRTTLSKLFRLLIQGRPGPDRLQDFDIVGDVVLMQKLYQVFSTVQLDWEDELAKWMGDIPARQVGNVLRWSRRQAADWSETIRTKVRNTLVDEQYLIAEKSKVDHFLNAVDTLQADVDRLTQRVSRLERLGRP